MHKKADNHIVAGSLSHNPQSFRITDLYFLNVIQTKNYKLNNQKILRSNPKCWLISISL